MPRSDTYIEKESSVNEQIDRMRHAATRALLERDDVIIVASVSCIYGIGSVETYTAMTFSVAAEREARAAPTHRRSRHAAVSAPLADFIRGTFPRARRHGRCVSGPLRGSRLADQFLGDEVESINEFDPLTGNKTPDLEFVKVYANSHYVTPRPTLLQSAKGIKEELKLRLDELNPHGPAHRGAAARAAHALRPGDDGGDGRLRRHRELFALSHRPQTGRAAADAVRISARQRPRLRRREPCLRAADRRHVSRRLPPQGDARRIRLPPALLHGQSAAALRGMGRDAAADGLRFGDARQLGDGAHRWRLRRAGHPPDGTDRSARRGARGAQPRSTICCIEVRDDRHAAIARW